MQIGTKWGADQQGTHNNASNGDRGAGGTDSDPPCQPEAGITDLTRPCWEGALAALEAVLGERSSLVDNLGSDLLKRRTQRLRRMTP